MNVLLASLFAVYGLFAVAFLGMNMPPFQNADEQNHFTRAYQISNGHLMGRAFAIASCPTAGGLVDPNITASTAGFMSMATHPDVRANRMDWAHNVRWSKTRTLIAFSNTAIYPPQFFLPAVIAVRMGRTVGLDIVQTLILARIFTGICAILVASAAVLFSDVVAPWIFAILTLPMALSQMSACSQDALLIAMSALIVALYIQAVRASTGSLPWLMAALALAFTLISTARPPLLTFALLILTVPRYTWRLRIGIFSVPVICTILWSAAVSRLASVNVFTPLGANPHEQIALIIHKPWLLLHAIGYSIWTFYPEYIREFIGKLGWLDTVLPDYYYLLSRAVLFFAFLACVCGAGEGSARVFRNITVSVAFLGCVTLIYTVQYITWSTPGGALISGVQGRYFITPELILCLMFPALGAWPQRLRPYFLMPVMVFPLITLATVMRTIVLRYYLQ